MIIICSIVVIYIFPLSSSNYNDTETTPLTYDSPLVLVLCMASISVKYLNCSTVGTYRRTTRSFSECDPVTKEKVVYRPRDWHVYWSRYRVFAFCHTTPPSEVSRAGQTTPSLPISFPRPSFQSCIYPASRFTSSHLIHHSSICS